MAEILALGALDPFDDEVGDGVVVVRDDWDRALSARLSGQHRALHGLGRRPADLGGSPIGADLAIGGLDVHAFPH